jgi:hypothetical protein
MSDEKYTLETIRSAKKQINILRADPATSPDELDKLESAYIELDALDDDLIFQEIGSKVTELEKASAELTKLADEMSKSTENIQKVAGYVDLVAKALAGIAAIAAKIAG